jgi:hypothetical protein
MSRPIQPSGTSTRRTRAVGVRGEAIGRARGPRQLQLAVALRPLQRRRASGTPSSSTSESPVGIPSARKKLKHIAPPIRIWSASSMKRSITPILS